MPAVLTETLKPTGRPTPPASPRPHVGAEETPGLRRARAVVRVLDDRYLDPILGFLVPGLGDIVSSATGLYLVHIARRRGLSSLVIARMLLNLALDAALGTIPVVGDLLDVGFKANKKNLELLDTRPTDGASTAGDKMVLATAALLFLAALCVPVLLLLLVLRALF